MESATFYCASVLSGATLSAESSTGESTIAAAVTQRSTVQTATGEQLAARGPGASPSHMADAVARLCHTQACFNDQLGSLGLD